MRFAKVERTDTGYFLDPTAYVDQLSTIRDQLPAGAARFATDPSHYEFSSVRCVKDLQVSTISLVDGNGQLSIEIRFAPNKFKHDVGLSIRYSNVTTISIEVLHEPPAHIWPATRRLGDVQLDEILPRDSGCSHEIGLTGGSITIVCADLHAEWDNEPGVEGGFTHDAGNGAE